MNTKSRHDKERDRIADSWETLPSSTCAACHEEMTFPTATHIETEVWIKDQFRADIAAIDMSGGVLGTIEIVDTHPPDDRVLASQESLGFAYYLLLPQKPRKGVSTSKEAIWLCSPECWRWYIWLAGSETSSPWEATKCAQCDHYIYQNPLSQVEFHDWGEDPHYAYCIRCAAAYIASGDCQWRTPGELAGGDPP